MTTESGTDSPIRKKMKMEGEDIESDSGSSEHEDHSESEPCNNGTDGLHGKESESEPVFEFKSVVQKLENMQESFMWTAKDWENILELIFNYSSAASFNSKNETNAIVPSKTQKQSHASFDFNNGVPSMDSNFLLGYLKPITCSLNHEECPVPEKKVSNLTTTNVVTVLDSIKQILLSEGFTQLINFREKVSTSITTNPLEVSNCYSKSGMSSQQQEGLNCRVAIPPLSAEIVKEVLDFIEKVSLQEVNILNSDRKKVNPLCNDLILSKIMEYLKLEDVLNCRLVNKFWTRLATPMFKNLQVKIDLSCGTDLFSFCRDMEDTSLFPFRFFKIRPNRIGKENVRFFFSRFGEFVEHIILKGESEDMTSQQVNEFKDSVRFILYHLPNATQVDLDDLPKQLVSKGFYLTKPKQLALKLPKVKFVRLFSDFRDEFEQEFIHSLFEIMPNVNRLTLALPEFQSSKQHIFVPSNLRLTNLELGCEDSWTPISTTLIEHLMLHRFFFEKLTFNINFITGDEATILEKFLLEQKNCLRVLHLQSTMDNDTRISFPIMSQLDTLSVYFDDDDSGTEEEPEFEPRMMCHPFKPFQFPVLRSLDIYVWCLSVLFPYDGNGGSFSTVTSIRLDYGQCSYIKNSTCLKYFEDIPFVFPKLTAFKVASADADVLSEIFSYLQYLEELEFEYIAEDSNADINNILCGFPSNTSWISTKFMDWKKNRSHAEFATMLELFTNPPHVCLLDMKRLKKLRLVCPDDTITDAETITDVSVYLAFLQIQHLDQLVMDRNASVSDEAIADLKKHHTNVTITRNPVSAQSSRSSSSRS